MRKCLTVFLTLFVLYFSGALFAQDETVVNDGVTFTGEKGLFNVFSTDTVPDGKISFSAGYRNVDRDPLDDDIAYYSVTLGYGVTDNFEIVALVVPYVGYDIDPKPPVETGFVNGRETFIPVGIHGSEYRSGFGDIRVGAKYVVRRGAFGFGVDGWLKIPTASQKEGRGTGKVDLGASAIVSASTHSVSFSANAGFRFNGDPQFRLNDGTEFNGEQDYPNAFTWGVGAAFPGESSVQGIVEFNGEVYSSEDTSLAPLIVTEPETWTDLSGGIRFRFADKWFFTAAATWNVQAERDQSEYPYGGIIQLAYAPGRAAPVEAVPPPPPAPPAPAPAPPPPAPAPPTPSVPEFVWPEIYFPFNQSVVMGDTSLYVITAENRQKLDSVATYMTDHPNTKVTIEGHCCYIGTEEYNLALGQARAEAIKQYLVGKGISADRMSTISYGKTKPKYDNEKEITRRFNRRGYFVAINPQ